MPLTALLKTSYDNTVSDDSGPWRQFILDHLALIARQSARYDLSAEQLYRYKHDLRRLLKTEVAVNRQEDIAWIVRLLNDISCDLEFVDPGEYIIPTDTLILNLYKTYMTVSMNES